MPLPEELRHPPNGLLVRLRRRNGNRLERRRRLAPKVQPELPGQNVAGDDGPQLRRVRVGRDLEPEAGLHELRELRHGPLLDDLGVPRVAHEPRSQDGLAPQRPVEDDLQERRRLRPALRCGPGQLLVRHLLRREEVVDHPVRVLLAEDVSGHALELRLVGLPRRLELHQERPLPVPLDARNVDEERPRRIHRHERLDRHPNGEERAIELGERRGLPDQGEGRRSRHRPRPAPGLADERLELPPRVVPDDDPPGLQPIGHLAGDVVVEGMHHRPDLSDQRLNTSAEHLKALRVVSLRVEQLAHLSSSRPLLVLGEELPKRLHGAHELIGIPIGRLCRLGSELRSVESLRHRRPVTDHPGLQFLARHAYENRLSATLRHQLRQARLHHMAVRSVLIAKHDERCIRPLPSTDLSNELPLQVLLALEYQVVDPDVRGEQPRQQPLEEVPGRRFLEEEHQVLHFGSAPSKSPCFQRYPSLSPSAM